MFWNVRLQHKRMIVGFFHPYAMDGGPYGNRPMHTLADPLVPTASALVSSSGRRCEARGAAVGRSKRSMQPARHAVQRACSSNAVRTHNLQHRTCNLPTACSVTQVAASVSFGARSLRSVRSCRMSTSSCAPQPAPYRPQDPQEYSADSDDRVGLHSYVKDGPHIADSGDGIIENACKHFGLPELGMGCLALLVALWLCLWPCCTRGGAGRIGFVRLSRTMWIEPKTYPRCDNVVPLPSACCCTVPLRLRHAASLWRRLTLLGQSFGALLLAWEGLTVC